MITIFFTEEQVAQAQKWSDEVMATNTMKRKNYTGLDVAGRYFIGYLGEIACCEWLKSIGADYMHKVRTDGKPGPVEIKVKYAGRYITIDTKFGNGPGVKRFMMPKSQYQKSDIYVGGRILDTDISKIGEVYGWIPYLQLQRLPIGEFGYNVPTRWCMLTDMNDLSILAKAIREGER